VLYRELRLPSPLDRWVECVWLVQRVTGSRIDPQPYLEYLERKYRPIYGIDRAA
jgi:hypothetical protein